MKRVAKTEKQGQAQGFAFELGAIENQLSQLLSSPGAPALDVKDWRSIKDAAKLLNMATKNVRRLQALGVLDKWQCAGRLGVSMPSILAYLTPRPVEPTATVRQSAKASEDVGPVKRKKRAA